MRLPHAWRGWGEIMMRVAHEKSGHITESLCSEAALTGSCTAQTVINVKQEWLFSFHSGGAFNTLRPRQNGRYFPDNTSKCTFLIENVWVSFKISLKFVPKVRNNNIPVLVQIMAWRWSGDKPLSEPMMIILLTHICITGPQWVNETKMTWNAWHLRWKMTWESHENSIHIIGPSVQWMHCSGCFIAHWSLM